MLLLIQGSADLCLSWMGFFSFAFYSFLYFSSRSAQVSSSFDFVFSLHPVTDIFPLASLPLYQYIAFISYTIFLLAEHM